MTASPAPSDTPVYLLAEHLDSTLAAIEDLRAATPPPTPMSPERPGVPRPSLGLWVRRLEALEACALLHVARARGLTATAMRSDDRLAMLGRLFLAGTATLDEALATYTDRTGNAFASGGDAIAYLRQRGVLPPDAATLTIDDTTTIGDDFRLAGEIEIEPLADLVATFLDTLEIHYDLFPAASGDEDRAHSGVNLR